METAAVAVVLLLLGVVALAIYCLVIKMTPGQQPGEALLDRGLALLERKPKDPPATE